MESRWRDWIANQRAAERRLHQLESETAPDEGRAVTTLLGLIAVAERLHGWPVTDAVRERDSNATREVWRRLHAGR